MSELIAADFRERRVISRDREVPKLPEDTPSAERVAAAMVDTELVQELLRELELHDGQLEPHHLTEIEAAFQRANRCQEEVLLGDGIVAKHLAATELHELRAADDLLQINRATFG